MKKRILKSVSLLLCLSLVLTLSACGTKGDSGSENDPPPVEEEVLTGTYAYDGGLNIINPKFAGDIMNKNLVEYYNFLNLADDGSLTMPTDSSGSKFIKITAGINNTEIIPASWLTPGQTYGISVTYLSNNEINALIGGEEVTFPSASEYKEFRKDFEMKDYLSPFTLVKYTSEICISKIIIYAPVREQEPALSGDTATVSYKFADTSNASEYGILIADGENKNLTAESAKEVKTFTDKNFSADIDLSGGAVTVRGYAEYPDGHIAYSSASVYTKDLLERREEYKEKTETYSLSDDSVYNNVVVLGRHKRVSNGVTFDYTAATLRFKAECMGEVAVKVHFEKKAGVNFAVLVDGKRQPNLYHLDFEGAGTMTLRFNVGNVFGEHEIEVVRSNERNVGCMELESFTLHGTLKKAEDKELFIEFLGDSVTCGGACYRNYTEDGSDSWGGDGTLAFSFCAAKALDCDYRMVSNSGYGFLFSSSGKTGEGAAWDTEYPVFNRWRNETEKYVCERKADIVCIYLGCNDVNAIYDGTAKADLSTLAASMVKTMTHVREYNPDAKVIWMIGGMTAGYGDAARLAVTQMGDKQAGFYTFEFESSSYHNGGYWHPSVKQHKYMSKQLIDFLEKEGLV